MSVLRLARRAMGTEFEIVLLGPDQDDLRAAGEAALEEIARVEDLLSAFLDTSEIGHLNARAGRGVTAISPELRSLLERCAWLHDQTGGAFDVALGAITETETWNEVTEAWARSHRALPSHARWCMTSEGVAVTRDAALDLGGVGKGYALDRAGGVLRDAGIEQAFLHGGRSTVLAIGAPPGESGWPVASPDGPIGLRDMALSVSETGRHFEEGVRRLLVGGVFQAQPTGREARVMCRHATDADALSTALVVGAADVVTRCVKRLGGTASGPRVVPAVSRREVLRGVAAAAAAFATLGSLGVASADEDPPAKKKASKPLRVGVVGTGVHGRLLLGLLTRMSAFRVQAICDSDTTALAAALKIAGRKVETYKDAAYMLEEESFDAVVIATPTHLHGAGLRAAIAAGLHVYVEAPLCRDAKEARALVAAAKKSDRVIHVGHQRRASKLYPHAVEHIGSGAIGKALMVRASWNRKLSWRRPGATRANEKRVNWRLYRATSGGLLSEYGTHVFDLANWMFGAPPTSAMGLGGVVRWKDGRDVDDMVHALLRYPEGRQLSFQASLVNSYGDERELLVGDAASILCLGQRKGLLFKEADTVAAGWEQYARSELLGGRRGIILDPEATKYVSHEKVELVGAEASKADFAASLAAFAHAVRTGGQPVCSVQDGANAVRAAHAAEAAIQQAKVITLDGG